MNKANIQKIEKSAAANYEGNLDAAICEHLGHPFAFARGGNEVPAFLADEVMEIKKNFKTPAKTSKPKVAKTPAKTSKPKVAKTPAKKTRSVKQNTKKR